jgi:5,10-methylene-tetrahydrofolate dehydrogenase/methenyl tetrahydrofolate cyclohydrolase
VPNYLKAEMVKDGAVVIDGITRVADETAEKDISLHDVDFDNE